MGAATSSTPPWAKIEPQWLLSVLKRLTIWPKKPAFARLALPDFLALSFAPQVHIVAKIWLRIVMRRTCPVTAHFFPHLKYLHGSSSRLLPCPLPAPLFSPSGGLARVRRGKAPQAAQGPPARAGGLGGRSLHWPHHGFGTRLSMTPKPRFVASRANGRYGGRMASRSGNPCSHPKSNSVSQCFQSFGTGETRFGHTHMDSNRSFPPGSDLRP